MKCFPCCEISNIHLKSTKQKDKKNADEAGATYRRKVILSTPQNSPIVNSLNKASVKEKESLHKFFKVAYLIVKKWRPFTDYHDLIKLEKLNDVKFDVTYDNKNACADFIKYISQSLFGINVKSNWTELISLSFCVTGQLMLRLSTKTVFLYCLLILMISYHVWYFFH